MSARLRALPCTSVQGIPFIATRRLMKDSPTLDDVLSESEQLLIVEALGCLKERKEKALRDARTKGAAGGRRFEERDYGLAAIDRLLKKF